MNWPTKWQAPGSKRWMKKKTMPLVSRKREPPETELFLVEKNKHERTRHGDSKKDIIDLPHPAKTTKWLATLKHYKRHDKIFLRTSALHI
mmetsp:Transcript_2113/g.4271  ORF Transcript_2113/g.4271 Transcript_2113/m.4271 type:complete len:90 (+) Transcript_2113:296-565(+)